MERAAVSAATGVMSSVLGKLADLLLDEYKLANGVREDIRFLMSELEPINDLLSVLADLEELDALNKGWRDRMRELAYDIEDCIDLSVARLGDASKDEGRRFGTKLMRKFNKIRVSLQVAHQIQELKARAIEESKRQKRYKLDGLVGASPNNKVDLRMCTLWVETEKLVGFDGPRNEIIRCLMPAKGEEPLQQVRTISIVGCAGLGKTTLANQVYQKIKGGFECKAFASVSQNPHMKDVLMKICSQVGATTSMADDELILVDKLRERLQHKRNGMPEAETPIVMDPSFPALPNLQTFSTNVFNSLPIWMGSLANLELLHLNIYQFTLEDLQVLGGMPALEILVLQLVGYPGLFTIGGTGEFQRLKSFQVDSLYGLLFMPGSMPNLRHLDAGLIYTRGSPKELGIQHLANLVKAKPAPLALAFAFLGTRRALQLQMEKEPVISFLLLTKPHHAEELEVLPIVGPGRVGKSTLVAHLVRKIKKIRVSLQVAHQIQELKARVAEESKRHKRYKLEGLVGSSCASPNNKVDLRMCALWVETEKLVGLDEPRDEIIRWLMPAEGEVKPSQQVRTLSIIGCAGLGKTTLAKQVYEKIKGDFDCKALVSVSLNPQIKDVLMKICSQVGVTTSMVDDEPILVDKLREHLQHKRSFEENFLTLLDSSGVPPSPLHSNKEFEVVRVLDLENCGSLRNIHLENIEMLLQLRYLSIRRTSVSELPIGIGQVQRLETLDIRETEVEQLPSTIVQLEKLARLFVGSKVKFPAEGFGKMQGLEQLTCFMVRKQPLGFLKELGQLTNLEILEAIWEDYNMGEEDYYYEGSEWGIFTSSLQALGSHKLHSLCFRDGQSEVEIRIPMDSSFPALSNLRTFSIGSFNSLPIWMGSLANLELLNLGISEFTEDDMQVLGGMPALEALVLSIGIYTAPLTISASGAFQRLKSFKVDSLYGVLFMPGSMPNLRHLHAQLYYTTGVSHDLGLQHLASLVKKSRVVDEGESSKAKEAQAAQPMEEDEEEVFESSESEHEEEENIPYADASSDHEDIEADSSSHDDE
nr:unnamed protein product [Digitaria exilis]